MQQPKEMNELNERVIILERMLQKVQIELGNKSVQIAELSTRLELEKGKGKKLEEALVKAKNELREQEDKGKEEE